jgi:hypothetical protein
MTLGQRTALVSGASGIQARTRQTHNRQKKAAASDALHAAQLPLVLLFKNRKYVMRVLASMLSGCNHRLHCGCWRAGAAICSLLLIFSATTSRWANSHVSATWL